MASHITRRHHHHAKRQDDPFTTPTVSGIETVPTTVATDQGTSAPSLAFDSGASITSQSAPDLAGTMQLTSHIAQETSQSASDPGPSESPSPSATGATHTLALKTVIASCIGAFVGALLLILIGYWLYRRYVRSLKRSYRRRGPVLGNRNMTGEQERRRSHYEAWTKLDHSPENQGPNEAKEQDVVSPMEKLTMFKKSPSVRTAWTHKSDEPMNFDLPLPLAQYHPEFAKHNAAKGNTEVAVHRPFIGRVDSGPTISWDSSTLASEPIGSLPHGSITSVAIPTPVATTSVLHRWESAEVINPDANPFETETERRKSASNPFFNAQESELYTHIRTRSNSMSSQKKGKERPLTDGSDAYVDLAAFPLPKPPFVHHAATASGSSVSSNERAIQSLIAALDVSEQEVHDRLRVASVNTSVSRGSVSSLYEDTPRSSYQPPQFVPR
ncbi:hypothetical protein AMATHDRAFT_138463 [Amanita thiersii Skay4041]|uniref:Uncharacterized protein n=1 Tax=Amanita thiersii Skay4041 TaxID=703135 RepID=A0A2A9NYN9_9AGAR|nr:hypothetical protein AMATHDRAFT_138463 [Amanita thiersii Skay4041]